MDMSREGLEDKDDVGVDDEEDTDEDDADDVGDCDDDGGCAITCPLMKSLRLDLLLLPLAAALELPKLPLCSPL